MPAIWVCLRAPASVTAACARKSERSSFRDGEAERALRRGFRALDRRAGRGAAARQEPACRRKGTLKPPARLGEPCRGDREPGEVGSTGVAIADHADPPAPPEAPVLSRGGASRGLAGDDRRSPDRDRG